MLIREVIALVKGSPAAEAAFVDPTLEDTAETKGLQAW